MPSTDDLKQAIVSFLTGYSIEATPHDEDKLDEIAKILPPGTSTYMAHLPGFSLDDIARLCVRMQSMGLTAVPHIVSRKLESRDQLARALETMAKGGVSEALVIGGDQAAPDARLDSSLEVPQGARLDELGSRAVGVARPPQS